MKKDDAKSQTPASEKPNQVTENMAGTQRPGAEPVERESVDRIRDILVGAQMRQYEQKFARLESLLQKEISELRTEARTTFETLETYFKNENESLSHQLKREQDERTEANRDLGGKLEDTNKALEKKISELNERVTKNQRDLQDQILKQSKTIRDELRENYERISSSNERSVNELRNDKTDRVALANLFIEIALRLKDEFDIAGIE